MEGKTTEDPQLGWIADVLANEPISIMSPRPWAAIWRSMATRLFPLNREPRPDYVAFFGYGMAN